MISNKAFKIVISSILVVATVAMGSIAYVNNNKSSKVKAAVVSKDIEFIFNSSALDDCMVHLVNDGVFNEDYFRRPSTIYNHDLAILSQVFALTSGNTTESMKNWGENYNHMIDTTTDDGTIDYEIHRNAYIVEVYKTLGFYNDVYKKYDVSLNDNSNTCGYSIAMKDIKVNDLDYKLVCLNVRSVNYGSGWGSNFYLSDESKRTGFEHAGYDVYEGLKEYLEEHNLDKRVKIWIPAYSRGAGVANVAAALLDKDISEGKYKFKKEDVYAYMCATPMPTLNEDGASSIYNNIFNTVIESDIVSAVAPKYWGYKRYGNVITIPHYFVTAKDIKNIEKGYETDIPEEQLKLMKKVSRDYNEIRHENALNELQSGDLIFDGFRVGPGVTDIIDYVAQMFAPTVYEYEEIWQDVVVEIVPFVIGQFKQYDEETGEWVKYKSLADFICDNYGNDAIIQASRAGVFSQSEYNKDMEFIRQMKKNNVITDEMFNFYSNIVDTFYGIKIISYIHGVSVEDIKGFVSNTIDVLPEIKKSLTPLIGAVNLKKNHYGEYYLAWLQNYNAYTGEVVY